MEQTRGLRKLFLNLSLASKAVAARHTRREELQGYLRKIKIVASRSAKKSVIHDEIAKLENHLSELLDRKLHIAKSTSKKEGELVHRVKEREQELHEKIAKLNELLAQVGKKVNEKKLLTQLDEPEPVSRLEELEHKLYELESKYYSMQDNPDYPERILANIRERISALKEKIRELKNK
jgi:chromosome segregation ATPase